MHCVVLQAKAAQEGKASGGALPGAGAAFSAKYEERLQELQTQLTAAQQALSSSQAGEGQLRNERDQLQAELTDLQDHLDKEGEERVELQNKLAAVSREMSEVRRELDVSRAVSPVVVN